MATRSRPSIPAVPTVVGATDDSSRGGLFSRSNLANPVSGADVNGVAIQDSTITIDINGNSQSFTLNQTDDETLSFTVEGGGGAGTPSVAFSGATIDDTSLILTLTGVAPQTDITVDLSRFALDSALTAIRDSIPTAIGDLTDVADTLGTAGQILAVNTGGTALEYVDQPTANVATTSFSSEDDTVDISPGTGMDANTVNLQARPTIFGNDVTGGNLGPTDSIQFTSIQFATGTNLAVQNTGGVITIVPMGEDPPDPPGPVTPRPTASLPMNLPMDVFTAPVDVPVTITVRDGTIPGMTDADSGLIPRITRDGTGVQTTPTIDIGDDRTSATITFDADDVDDEGEYDISIVTPVEDSAGTVTTRTFDEDDGLTFNRVVPFFQSRVQITASNLRSNTVTDTAMAWPPLATGFTAIPLQAGATEDTPLYFAVRTSDFSGITNGEFDSVLRGRDVELRFRPVGSTFEVNDHANTPITFQTYMTSNIGAGAPLRGFRVRD